MIQIERKGINFRNYKGALVPDVPPHIPINLNANDLKFLLKKSNAYFVRWITYFDKLDKSEYWYVIKDDKFSLDDFDSKKRYQIKKGLKNCIVKKVDIDFISKNCYETYIKAFSRYDTYVKPLSKIEYVKEKLKFKDDLRRDYWVVMNKENQIIGYAQNIIEYNMCSLSQMKFDADYLYLYSSYALIYTMCDYYLNICNLMYVSDGTRCIDHNSNIQDFLINKFKFRKAYCKLNIEYNFMVKAAVNILYIFKGAILKSKINLLGKLRTILKLEEIKRQCKGI